MNLEFITDYFKSLSQPEKSKSKEARLDTIKMLCSYFGNPERSCPCIHVAGSKGKGSITTMVGSILKSAGIEKVGLYRSPAITHFTDRISSVDGPFSKEVYEKAFGILRTGIENLRASQNLGHLTYYELVTLLGFLVFREAKCDFVVYEVGAGGRLDATNVVYPKVSIINTIELEHTETLGDTLEKIAAEKAGIIKENVPVIVGPQLSSEVKNVFRTVARKKHAKTIIFATNNLHFDYYLDDNNYLKMRVEELGVDLSLVGKFQADNALVAKLAIEAAMPQISETDIKTGLENAWLPGRFEIITSRELVDYPKLPYLILDGAHTVRSIDSSVETLEIYRKLLAKQKTYDSCLTDFSQDKKPILLFACAKDKKVEDMVSILAPHFSEAILTTPGGFKTPNLPRANSAFLATNLKITLLEDYIKAIQTAIKKANEKSLGLVVLGSLYLVGAVKDYLKEESGIPW